MVDLLNTKVWIGNDKHLYKQLEQLAFSQGFYWEKRVYDNKIGKTRDYYTQTSRDFKNVYYLYFIETIENKKIISQELKTYPHISIYNTRRNRFDHTTNAAIKYRMKNALLKELTIADLQLNLIHEVW